MKPKTSLCLLATVLAGPVCHANTIFSWETGTEGWAAGAGASIATSTTGATDGIQSLSVTTPMSGMWYSTPTSINLDPATRQALFTGATELKLDVSYPNPGYNSWWATPSVEVIIQGDGVSWTTLGVRDVPVNGPPQTFTWPLTVGQASALAAGTWGQVILKFTYGNGGSTGTDAVFYVDNLASTVVIVEPPVADFFWKGDVSGSWTDLNWTTDPEGSIAAGALTADGTAGIAFAATGATNLDTTLGADQNVLAMIFTAGTGSVNIGGTHNLTIGGDGILAEATAGQVVIDTTGQVILSADQLWANNTVSPLIVDSAISGNFKLTTGGTGMTLLGAANSHTGGTVVQQGTLILGNALALGPVTTTLGVTGGTVDLKGLSPIIGGLSCSLGGVITNLAPDPATLTLDNDQASAYSAAINDGIGTVSLVKTGTGSLTLGGAGTFTGNVTIQEGAVTAGSFVGGAPVTSNFGNAQVPGRTITVESAASLLFNTNDILGNAAANMAALPTTVLNGSTLDATRYNQIGNLTLNGGTLTQSSSDAGAYQGWQFQGQIEAVGTSQSFIASGNGKGNHLSGETVFNVADVTGDADADLIVTSPLVNQSGNFGSAAGGLSKSGPGTLALDGVNTYTGVTRVTGGTLSLGNPSLADGAAVELGSGVTLDLAFEGSDVVSGVVLDGLAQGTGSFGAPGSGADHELSQITGNGMLLVLSDPFVGWIGGFPSLSGPDAAKGADPDQDGLSNLEEFAFNGDPTRGADSGKIRSRVETLLGQQALVITLPVRTGAVFAGSVPAAATLDGLVYEIAGSNDLSSFDQGVSEIVPALVSDPEMPALDAGWSYRTFRLNGDIGGAVPRGPKGFVRASVIGTP